MKTEEDGIVKTENYTASTDSNNKNSFPNTPFKFETIKEKPFVKP